LSFALLLLRHAGGAATAAEKAHVTKRITSEADEPTTGGGGGDDGGGGGDDGNPPPDDEPDPNDPDDDGSDWSKVDEEEATTDKTTDENIVLPHWVPFRDKGVDRTSTARDKLVNPADPNTPVNSDTRNELTFAYGEIFEVNILNPDMEQGIVNGVSVSTNSTRASRQWGRFNGDEEFLKVPGATQEAKAQALGELANYVKPVITRPEGQPQDLRYADAEIAQILKFMQWLDQNPNKKAVLRIFVSHRKHEGPCPSCENVIRWFNQQSRFKDQGQIATLAEDGKLFEGWDAAPEIYTPTP
jgi:hypothetical protein